MNGQNTYILGKRKHFICFEPEKVTDKLSTLSPEMKCFYYFMKLFC